MRFKRFALGLALFLAVPALAGLGRAQAAGPNEYEDLTVTIKPDEAAEEGVLWSVDGIGMDDATELILDSWFKSGETAKLQNYLGTYIDPTDNPPPR